MDVRIQWRRPAAAVVVTTALAAGGASAIANEGGAAPPPDGLAAPTGTSAAIAERFDALVEAAAARLAAERPAAAAPPPEVEALRAELTAARTQIEVLNAIVVEALVAQYSAEAEVRAARQDSRAQIDALLAERDEADARNLMLADQVEVLADRLAELRDEVELLGGGAAADVPVAAPEPDTAPAPTSANQSGSRPRSFAVVGTAAAAPVEGFPAGDGTLSAPPVAGEAPAAAAAPIEPAAAPSAPIEVGRVHFDPGSAALTPGGERMAREAAARIRSMDVERVRIVGFTDTVGAPEVNRHLALVRARSIATLLEDVGIPSDRIEVVAHGEDGVPEPTADHVSEPLNRCAGIFVETAYPK